MLELLIRLALGLLKVACLLGFAFLVVLVVSSAETFSGKVRRGAGAVVPLVILLYLYTLGSKANAEIAKEFGDISFGVRILIGGILAVVGLEIVRILNFKSDVIAALFAMCITSLPATILWVLLIAKHDSLNALLFGFVLCGGIHFVVRGPSDLSKIF